MTFNKSSGKKVIKECEDCKVNLNGKPVYQTLDNPPRRLCKVCMAIYLDIQEFP